MKTFAILLGFWAMIAVAYAQEGGKTDRWSCGQPMTDPRDNQVYNTIQIGTQCWMAGNLNIGTRIDSSGSKTDLFSFFVSGAISCFLALRIN